MKSTLSLCSMVKIIVCFFLTITFGLITCKAKEDKSFRNGDELLSLYYSSIQDSIDEVSKVSGNYSKDGWLSRTIKDIDANLQPSIRGCRELLSLALYNLYQSSTPIGVPTYKSLVDFNTGICATMANIETCLNEFKHAPKEAKKIVLSSMESSINLMKNSLSILYKIDDPNLGSTKGSRNAWPPSWLSFEDRKLLLDSKDKIAANVVVAKDGSGNYKTVSEAINDVPQQSTKRFIIYVKEGIYYENVRIDSTKWNVMMYGDGMHKTIISGKLSNISGASTVESATFGVHGPGFIARSIGFQNTAGPSKGQAVALLSTSDKSVIFRCSIDGYQDSLFAQSNRQFYRESHIYGTVDFIFGYSSAVFQNCTILVKKPLHGQANTITAQGKSDSHCLSGFSFQYCVVKAAEDLDGVATYLGRPWKNFSTTVFMESFLDSLIDPKGWDTFGPNVPPPDTIYYGEYKNKGPGSGTGGRVTWKGVRSSMSDEEAQSYTVRNLIGGDQWLPATGVPFTLDL